MLLQHTKPVCSKCTHFRTKRLKATLLWRVFCAGLACKCCCAKHEAKCTVLVSSGAFIAFLADIGEKDIRLNIQEMQKNPIRATFHATCFLKRTRFQVCSWVTTSSQGNKPCVCLPCTKQGLGDTKSKCMCRFCKTRNLWLKKGDPFPVFQCSKVATLVWRQPALNFRGIHATHLPKTTEDPSLWLPPPS